MKTYDISNAFLEFPLHLAPRFKNMINVTVRDSPRSIDTPQGPFRQSSFHLRGLVHVKGTKLPVGVLKLIRVVGDPIRTVARA